MTPEAQAHYDRGGRFFAAQRYGDAIKEFQDGYVVDAAPEFLYGIGQAERLNGDCADAINAYQQYLEQAGSPADAVESAKQDNARAMMAQCQSQPGVPASKPTTKANPKTSPPQASKVTPSPPKPTPTPKPPKPTPSPALTPAPATPGTTASTGPSFYSDHLADALVGGGAVALLVGVGVIAYADSQASSAQNLKEAEFTSQYSGAGTTSTVGLILGVAGGLAIAGGVTHFLLSHSGSGSGSPGADTDRAAARPPATGGGLTCTLTPAGLGLKGTC
jgi:hypothetical protein